MRATGHQLAPLLLLLLVWTASKVHTAAVEAGKRPCSPDDLVVFHTAQAPPLTCAIDSDCDLPNGTEADFRLGARIVRGSPYQLTSYLCKFPESDNSNNSLLFLSSIPEFPSVFEQPYWIKEEHVRIFVGSSVFCLFDSDLPDDFFHIIVQRPHEEAPLKCRVRDEDSTLLAKFPGYPTVVCDLDQRRAFSPSTYRFKLPDIAGEPFSCAFLAYDEVKLADVGTEQRLHLSLVGGLPSQKSAGRPLFSCSRAEAADGEPDFQLRMAAGDFYSCRFLDSDQATTETSVRRFFGW